MAIAFSHFITFCSTLLLCKRCKRRIGISHMSTSRPAIFATINPNASEFTNTRQWQQRGQLLCYLLMALHLRKYDHLLHQRVYQKQKKCEDSQDYACVTHLCKWLQSLTTFPDGWCNMMQHMYKHHKQALVAFSTSLYSKLLVQFANLNKKQAVWGGVLYSLRELREWGWAEAHVDVICDDARQQKSCSAFAGFYANSGPGFTRPEVSLNCYIRFYYYFIF